MHKPKGMNALRMRVVKLDPGYGAGEGQPFAIQVSQDGLVWFTIGRFDHELYAKEYAQKLAGIADSNMTVQATHILWSTRV